MQTLSFQEIIERYGLKPHPEGGFYSESYRSSGTIPRGVLPSTFKSGTDHRYLTSIYFLLPAGSKSNLHRLAADEIWHFYLGGPMTLVQILPDGHAEEVTLGQDIMAGQKVQHVVPKGCWFGGYPDPGTAYSFVGCDVAPGFEFEDFEIGDRGRLMREFPRLKSVIERLTK